MSTSLESVTSLQAASVYVAVGAAALGEAAAIVGLATAGETTLFLGGVVASHGNTDPGMLPVVVASAIAGRLGRL